jgi:hypothetical protein
MVSQALCCRTIKFLTIAYLQVGGGGGRQPVLQHGKLQETRTLKHARLEIVKRRQVRTARN